MVDWCWCFENPKEAAAEIKKLRHEIAVMTHGIEIENESLRARLAESEAECLEQSRLNGMGSEREARLMARVAELERELESNDEYVLRIEHNNHSLRKELVASQHQVQQLREALWWIRETATGSELQKCIEALSLPHDITELDALKKDADRLNQLATLFERKWNGVVGSGGYYHWHLVGPYRHVVAKMKGETFGEAIDEAIKESKK